MTLIEIYCYCYCYHYYLFTIKYNFMLFKYEITITVQMKKNLRKNLNLTRRRISRVLSVSRKKGKPLITIRALLRDFAQNTTLLGVSHVLKRRNSFWLIASGFCFIMSIVQSWGVAQQFFEESTKQKYLIINQKLMPFPSVTVCTNLLLPPDYDMNEIPGYNSSETISEEDSYWNINMEAVLQYVRYNLSEQERIELSLDINKFVGMCLFNYKPCNFSSAKDVYIFNNPAYGNCFTINPAFNQETALMVTAEAKLQMELLLPQGYRIKSGGRSVVVLIHKSGSAPTLTSGEIILVQENMFALVKIQLVERKFLRKNHLVDDMPTCIGRTEEPYQKNSLYYSEKSPYVYTLPACLKSCDQTVLKEKCSSIGYHFPFQSQEYENGLTIQSPKNTCDIQEEDRKCRCPMPCEFLSYTVFYDSTANNPRNYRSNELINSSKSTKDNTETKHRSTVMIGFINNYYESIQEELELSFTELLGILGGNMSLWIGLCFLSVLELVELIWNIFKIWFRQRRSKMLESINVDPVYNLAPVSQIKPYKYSATSLVRITRQIR